MPTFKFFAWRFRLLFLGLVCAGPAYSSVSGACAKVVITADPGYPPLHWYDGQKLSGASLNIVSRVFDDIGVPYEIKYVGPWVRVLRTAELGGVDMVATLKDTPERRAYLVFPSIAAFSNPVAVFVPRNTQLRYTKWEDLIGKRGGVTLGNKFGGGFDEFMAARLSVETANQLEQSFRKLQVGRIDYAITGLYTGLAYLVEHKQQDDFVALKPYVTETENYAAFVKASPCLKHLPAFEKRLAELVQHGEAQRILHDSVEQWKQRAVH